MKQEVYLTTLELMHTYGFIKIAYMLWGIPIMAILIFLVCRNIELQIEEEGENYE